MENIAEKVKQSGSMIALFIPIEVGKTLQEIFEDVPGDKVLPRDEHVTLLLVENFSGNKKDKIGGILKKVAAEYKPLSVSIKSFGLFSPNAYNENRWVLYAKPECEEFQSIHSDLKSICDKNGIIANNGNFNFSPHITIKYCINKPDITQTINKTFFIDRLAFAIGDKHYFVNLG